MTHTAALQEVHKAIIKTAFAELNRLVAATMGADGNPVAPDRKALIRARSILPPWCEHALTKPSDFSPAKPGKKTVVFLKTEHATGDVVFLNASDVVALAEVNDGVAVVKALAAELGEDGEVVNVVRSVGMTNTAAGSEVVILMGLGDIGLPLIPRGGDIYIQGIFFEARGLVAEAK